MIVIRLRGRRREKRARDLMLFSDMISICNVRSWNVLEFIVIIEWEKHYLWDHRSTNQVTVRVIVHSTEIPAIDISGHGKFSKLIKKSSVERKCIMHASAGKDSCIWKAPSAWNEGKRRIRFRNFQVSIKIRATRKPRALEDKERNDFFSYLLGAGYKWLFRMNFNVLRTDPINYSSNSPRSNAANCFIE